MDHRPVKVCMISCLHGLYDDRIYWKEALSLKKHGYDVTHIGISDTEFDIVSEHGIRLISIKRTRYYSNPYIDILYRKLTFKASLYKKIFEKAVSIEADVYHFHDYQINRIGKQLKELPHKPKVVYDVHEPYPVTVSTTYSTNPFKKLILKLYGIYIGYWEKSKAKYCDLIITTEANVKHMFEQQIKDVPVEIIYNYVDAKLINHNREKIYDFIYCGGIRRRRGIYEILQAFKQLNDRGIKFKALLIGTIHDQGLKEEINLFKKENKLDDVLEIKEFVPYNNIHEYYEISKIGLAIFNDEKVNNIIMPIKLFEYIVYGLPVIASNFGHMKEITLKNNTGLLVDPSDSDELFTSMEKLLVDKLLYHQLHDNCLHLSGVNFTWKIMEEKLINLYRNLLY